jgi:hypothetical protein
VQALEISERLEVRELQRVSRKSRQRCNNQLIALPEDRRVVWDLIIQTCPKIQDPTLVLLL